MLSLTHGEMLRDLGPRTKTLGWQQEEQLCASPSTGKELGAVLLPSALAAITSTAPQSPVGLPQHHTSVHAAARRRAQPYLGLGKHSPPLLAACLLLGFAKGEFGPPALKSFNIYASGRPLAPGIGTVTPPEPHDHIPHNNAPQARRARAGFRRPKVPLFLILKHKAAILSKKLTQKLRKAGISPGNHASEAARPQLDP